MKRSVSIIAVVSTSLTLVLSAPVANAAFPGKNGRIAFAIDRGNGSEISTMRPNGTGWRRLTHQDRSAWFPSWSPDGTKIVFQLNIPGEICGSIELMNVDGTGLVDLTSVSPRFRQVCGNGPSFTPDGQRIVFAGGSDSLPDAIWSFNLNGKDVRHIILSRRLARFADDRELKSPRISPDGRTLCFEVESSLSDGTNGKGLFTVNMNGNDLRQIVPFSYDVSIRAGDWSPSGNRIVFSSNAGYSGQTVFTEPQNIFTTRRDGTGLRQLTEYHRLPPDLSTGAGSYSPDGRWIMFKHVNGGKNTIWKMHPDGTHLTRIARSKFSFTGATEWGPRPS